MQAVNNNAFLPTYRNGPINGNRNDFIQRVSSRLSYHHCPIILRYFKEAQFSYEGAKLGHPDPEPIRVKILIGTTVVGAFCLATRVFWTALKTLGLVVSVPYGFGRQTYFGYNGEVQETFKRARDEWIDLGVSIVLPFIGIVKFFKPNFCDGFIDSMTEGYIKRIDEYEARDRSVQTAINDYDARCADIQRAWDARTPYPNV